MNLKTQQDNLQAVLLRELNQHQPALLSVPATAGIIAHRGMPYPYSVHGNVVFCPFAPLTGLGTTGREPGR